VRFRLRLMGAIRMLESRSASHSAWSNPLRERTGDSATLRGMTEMIQFDFVNRRIVLVGANGSERPAPKELTVVGNAVPPQPAKG
jgi:hypothetical protein